MTRRKNRYVKGGVRIKGNARRKAKGYKQVYENYLNALFSAPPKIEYAHYNIDTLRARFAANEYQIEGLGEELENFAREAITRELAEAIMERTQLEVVEDTPHRKIYTATIMIARR